MVSGIRAEPGPVGFCGPSQDLDLILNQWEVMSRIKTGESGSFFFFNLHPRPCPLASEGGEGTEKEAEKH